MDVTKRALSQAPDAALACDRLPIHAVTLRIRLLIYALVAVGASAPWADDEPADSCGLSFDTVQFEVCRNPLDRETASYRRDMVALLAAREYDALEEHAAVALKEKQRFANGLWKLHQFYTAFALADADPDSAWEARLDQLREWQTARRASATASIALAEVYTAYAWKAPADQSDSANEGPFRDRLEAGLTVLEDARALGIRDPHYWRAAHAIAAGLDWSTEELNDLYKKAAALEPHYWSNDIARISSLLARNGGDPQTVEAVAATASAAADEYGDEIYARAAWAVNEVSGSFLQGTAFDWERVQAGYRTLLQRHPDSTDLLSQYCILACRAHDKAAARKCFSKLGGKADLRAFKSARGYERHLRWANWN